MQTWTIDADVIDGGLTIEHDGEDRDLIILPEGTAEPAIFEVGPRGAEEENMDRADEALAAAGWKRVSDWQERISGHHFETTITRA